MNARRYIDRIEELLWTGRLQGNAILELYQLIQVYISGAVSKEVLEDAIDLHDQGWMP
ncbi:hypothetical protein NDI45_28510 [Leptolyngbya sp. GB1-A1]|uniref:hypothetical protein n=1 Tax=Leptolyngbya sp. GB1-A1 TaxID=2933908 RepID=UPI0032991253